MSKYSSALPLLLFVVFLFVVIQATIAEESNNAPCLVYLDSDEGQAMLLANTTIRADFFPLVQNFVTQETPSFCGVASISMALNSLKQLAGPANDTKTGEIGNYYNQDNVWDNKATAKVITKDLVRTMGMTLPQLAGLLNCFGGVKAEAYHISDIGSVDAFRAMVVPVIQKRDSIVTNDDNNNNNNNATIKADFVLVNYRRTPLGQGNIGHISPLGAYSPETDSFLILDVARYKFPPVWVPTQILYEAMNTIDSVTGKTRGFVIASSSNFTGNGDVNPFAGPGGSSSMLSLIITAAGVVAAVSILVGLLFGSVTTCCFYRFGLNHKVFDAYMTIRNKINKNNNSEGNNANVGPFVQGRFVALDEEQ